MRSSSLSILLGWIAHYSVAEQIQIGKACGGVSGITHCNSQFFTYPTTTERILCMSPYETTGSLDDYFSRSIYNLERCIADDGITIKTDRPTVIQSQISNTRGWTVARGPDVDMPLYRQLVKAMEPCELDGCDPVKLRDFFAGYISNAEGITDSEFVRMLNTWVSIFETLKKQVAAVSQASELVQTRLATVNGKVGSTRASVCKGTACKSSTVTAHFGKNLVSTMLSTVKGLGAVTGLSDKGTKNLPGMLSLTKNSLSYTKSAAEGSYYVDLFQNFKMSTLRDFAKAFKVTEYFPPAVEKIKNSLVPISDIKKYAAQGRTGLTQIDYVLGVQWSKNKELAKTAAGRKVRDGFINIQKSVKTELRTPVYNLIKAIDALQVTVDKLPLTTKKLEWSFGAAPYNRWSEHEMKVPCAQEKTQTFMLNGWPSAPFTWTEVTSCEWGPTKIPYSKNFIPYIKYRFV
ncbi:uncharacterized protein NECHADRAFT_87422 [Fusarium vanettenii 77-13-4]|uniref:Uncharacterized protein n=1 Tax=Fusarium vanettenii (strain ATCC MYA-4622 / CBS 123669 / FGSC 9596 / NRRL 45880 / 77-13-4) TaxID=660122 RepID=C7ZEE2_FUSV7|nr:uncharacterized protein NECHADRAFT_87422 [Fusarium vanettenii 77-13-4]EEU37658.1 hypothetical protein NECHADRAFT_87422 [Fusarium vanettenii 77-13-4]